MKESTPIIISQFLCSVERAFRYNLCK